MFNQVILIGNLGRNPEIRYTATGTAVANFSLATEDSYKGKDDEWVTDTQWHRCVAWGRLAESLAERLTVGTKVLVVGQVRYGSYTNNDGNEVKTADIRVDKVRVIYRAKQGGDAKAPAPEEEIPF